MSRRMLAAKAVLAQVAQLRQEKIQAEFDADRNHLEAQLDEGGARASAVRAAARQGLCRAGEPRRYAVRDARIERRADAGDGRRNRVAALARGPQARGLGREGEPKTLCAFAAAQARRPVALGVAAAAARAHRRVLGGLDGRAAQRVAGALRAEARAAHGRPRGGAIWTRATRGAPRRTWASSSSRPS